MSVDLLMKLKSRLPAARRVYQISGKLVEKLREQGLIVSAGTC